MYDDRGPWDGGSLAWGREASTFTFDGIEGQGEAHTSSPGAKYDYGSTVFTCGDHYLAMSIRHASVMAGDMRENLIALTQSALPWLCQDQPIPGLGKTMEQARPYYAYPTPLPSPTPTNTPNNPDN
ncbi:urea ABC transporter substrate-binding protein [Actinomyces ruminis]|uniref:Urea ABC transporter substrate-binding protein n=1 Tax=Actinomyces ruminis TaxID=1937003 RepID=A0ABX4M8C5_9ACTO|nr:urea ABC transporter substrate-binding protein [Actinomyces ruminis]